MEEQVKSRFSAESILLTAFIFLLSIGGIIFCIYGLCVDHKDAWKIWIGMVYFPLMFIGITRYMIRHLAGITIYKDRMHFRFLFKEVLIYWKDIEYISLTDSHFLHFLVTGFEYDAIALFTKDEKRYTIPYRHYSNFVRLARLLEKVEKNREQGTYKTIDLDEPLEKFSAYEKPNLIEGEKFSGSIFRVAAFYGLLSFCLFVGSLMTIGLYSRYSFFAFFFSTPLCLFFAFILSTRIDYFVLSEHYLMVRNTIFFWRKKVYTLDEIRIVFIRKPTNGPPMLKIITQNFNSKNYSAETLRKKTWEKLAEELSSRKVEVRIEPDLS